jgi:hypothetical protein
MPELQEGGDSSDAAISIRQDGTFSRDDFTYDHVGDVYSCPAGKMLTMELYTDVALDRRLIPRSCCIKSRRCLR